MLIDYKIDGGILTQADISKEDALNVLELSGRKTYWSQGYYGQDVVVAVIDTGVNEHQELQGRVLKGRNCNSLYKSIYDTKDDNMHGSHVSGTIAGTKVGIAPQAKILPIKVLDATGGCTRPMDIVDGINYATKWRGPKGERVDIISMSLSATKNDWGIKTYNAMQEAIKNCIANNILPICSMGNTSNECLRFPAGFDDSVAVGSVSVDLQRSYFSTKGSHIDVCQVGENIISCYYAEPDKYIALSGTSMSTPIISGITALIVSKYKAIHNGERIDQSTLYRTLIQCTRDLGIKGTDKEYGAGFCSLSNLQRELKLINGEKVIYVNKEPVAMDTPIIINEDNRFMVPIRFLAEALGGYINFEHDERGAIATIRF